MWKWLFAQVRKQLHISQFNLNSTGAIQLVLKVAQDLDRENAALAWVRDGCPEQVILFRRPGNLTRANKSQDARERAFEARRGCYELVHLIINAVDQSAKGDASGDPHLPSARRRKEAYEEINNSDDEVFQGNLYDWYLTQGWNERLLEVQSPHVVAYLQRKSAENISHADLLWRYFARYSNYIEAAKVQLQLARSSFDISLQSRLEYLSKAKTNASTRTVAVSAISSLRQSKQELIREASDLLEIGNIQDDILQKMKADSRLSAERRPVVLKHLDGQIMSLSSVGHHQV